MRDLAADFATDGFVVFEANADIRCWADAAHARGCDIAADPVQRAKWLRHGDTWFVGVDALPNRADGSLEGVPLVGPWDDLVASPSAWHPAQLSVVYPGYPKRDDHESEAAHLFRMNRSGAHMDGLHLENSRRIVREPHAFILGIPLNISDACRLVIWRKSHVSMRKALADVIGDKDPIGVDVTDAYKAARAEVFETCLRLEVHVQPGQAVLVDRFALHGIAPWKEHDLMPREGRMVAYFRPQFENANDWLCG